MNAYITRSELGKYLGINISASIDTYVTMVIESASDYVETLCGMNSPSKRRKFVNADTDTTRYYDGNDATRLRVDDVRSITSLTVDGIALTETTDYFLYPKNAIADGVPYEWIELIQPVTRLLGQRNSRIEQSGSYTFIKRQNNVIVTGKFGYSVAAPSAVKMAVARIAGAIIKENIGDTDLKELTQESLGEYNASFVKVADIANRIGVVDMLRNYTRAENIKNQRSGFIVAS